MNKLICSKCEEDNPLEAVLCWACYTPLKSPQRQRQERLHRAFDIVLGLGLAGFSLMVRSWWGYAGGAAGLALACGARPLVTNYWRATRARIDMALSATDDPVEQIDPCERIVDTILQYATKDGATTIEWKPVESGVQVFYEIDGKWLEQMKVPKYVREPVGAVLKEREAYKTDEGVQYRVHTTIDLAHYGERLIVDLLPLSVTPTSV